MDIHDYHLQNKINTTHFWYAARKKLIEKIFIKLFGNEQSSRTILDIGCGTGTELSILNKFGNVVGTDINKEALLIAKSQKHSVLYHNLENDKILKESQDVICCFDVLEHLKNDDLALSKIFEGLKPGGMFIFTVPAMPWLFSEHDRAVGHYRRYKKSIFHQKLICTGFNKINLYYWNFFLFLPIAIFRIIKISLRKITKGEEKSDGKNLPSLINSILYYILNLENLFYNKKLFPFGLTIYGIAKK
ncbi:MAG: class I SAM-dependent methyltransferase [Candidatus Falkowbacteria bacterium]